MSTAPVSHVAGAERRTEALPHGRNPLGRDVDRHAGAGMGGGDEAGLWVMSMVAFISWLSVGDWRVGSFPSK